MEKFLIALLLGTLPFLQAKAEDHSTLQNAFHILAKQYPSAEFDPTDRGVILLEREKAVYTPKNFQSSGTSVKPPWKELGNGFLKTLRNGNPPSLSPWLQKENQSIAGILSVIPPEQRKTWMLLNAKSLPRGAEMVFGLRDWPTIRLKVKFEKGYVQEAHLEDLGLTPTESKEQEQALKVLGLLQNRTRALDALILFDPDAGNTLEALALRRFGGDILQGLQSLTPAEISGMIYNETGEKFDFGAELAELEADLFQDLDAEGERKRKEIEERIEEARAAVLDVTESIHLQNKVALGLNILSVGNVLVAQGELGGTQIDPVLIKTLKSAETQLDKVAKGEIELDDGLFNLVEELAVEQLADSGMFGDMSQSERDALKKSVGLMGDLRHMDEMEQGELSQRLQSIAYQFHSGRPLEFTKEGQILIPGFEPLHQALLDVKKNREKAAKESAVQLLKRMYPDGYIYNVIALVQNPATNEWQFAEFTGLPSPQARQLLQESAEAPWEETAYAPDGWQHLRWNRIAADPEYTEKRSRKTIPHLEDLPGNMNLWIKYRF